MNAGHSGAARRILVTGSRGKSSVVRMLHVACGHAGLRTFARITGVVPRELAPGGTRAILRTSGAHVGEMRWWLRSLPADAQCIILENSAIAPELQGLAGRWLRPEVTVLTNTVPDHQEAWGPTRAGAAEALAAGIPARGPVMLPAGLECDRHLLDLLKRRGCQVLFAEPVRDAGETYRAVNLGLALAALEHLGLAPAGALESMLRLAPDPFDFRVVRRGGAELAMAFSANDVSSTRTLFETLGWPERETRLVYNHRADRPARLRSFRHWLDRPWREVLIIGDRPWRRGPGRYARLRSATGLLSLLRPGDRVFGCGNMAGLPMSLAAGPG